MPSKLLKAFFDKFMWHSMEASDALKGWIYLWQVNGNRKFRSWLVGICLQ